MFTASQYILLPAGTKMELAPYHTVLGPAFTRTRAIGIHPLGLHMAQEIQPFDAMLAWSMQLCRPLVAILSDNSSRR